MADEKQKLSKQEKKLLKVMTNVVLEKESLAAIRKYIGIIQNLSYNPKISTEKNQANNARQQFLADELYKTFVKNPWHRISLKTLFTQEPNLAKKLYLTIQKNFPDLNKNPVKKLLEELNLDTLEGCLALANQQVDYEYNLTKIRMTYLEMLNLTYFGKDVLNKEILKTVTDYMESIWDLDKFSNDKMPYTPSDSFYNKLFESICENKEQALQWFIAGCEGKNIKLELMKKFQEHPNIYNLVLNDEKLKETIEDKINGCKALFDDLKKLEKGESSEATKGSGSNKGIRDILDKEYPREKYEKFKEKHEASIGKGEASEGEKVDPDDLKPPSRGTIN